MKNLNIMGLHWKIPFLGWEVQEKPIYRRELPKKGGGDLDSWTVCRVKGGLDEKEGGWYPNTPIAIRDLLAIRYTDGSIGCKNFSRTSFSSTEISSLIPSYYFFIRATHRTAQISFPFFEWKLGVSVAPQVSLKMATIF